MIFGYPNRILLKTVSLSFVLFLFSILITCKKIEREAKLSTTEIGVTNITINSAKVSGEIIDLGQGIDQHGHCWGTSANPTLSGSRSSQGKAVKTGIFTSDIVGLTPNTLYYVRAYIQSKEITLYGKETSFTTIPIVIATLTTTAVTSITLTTAVSGGNITADGGGAITSKGVCWATTTAPTISNSKTSDGTGTGSFTSNLTGLLPNTKYYLRAYATNSAGTSYGNEVSFTTNPVVLAAISTTSVTSITQTTAVSGGNITSDGGGAITTRGVCWATAANPTVSNNITTNGTGTGSFTSNLSGLLPGTIYYVRAYATNSAGTAYGNEVSFATPPSGITVTDIDGNVYNTVTIGTQVWMKENLKTTKFNDGSTIPPVTDNAAWSNLSTPGYCWYNNDATTYKATYGALYNWYTVSAAGNGGKNVCPTGWHVPTDAEWTTLTTYLGGESVAGGKLKETGTTHWLSPNAGATNESSFTALPGGFRSVDGTYLVIWNFGYWWSSTEYSAIDARYRYMFYNNNSVSSIYSYKEYGLSVRCLKD